MFASQRDHEVRRAALLDLALERYDVVGPADQVVRQSREHVNIRVTSQPRRQHDRSRNDACFEARIYGTAEGSEVSIRPNIGNELARVGSAFPRLCREVLPHTT